VQSSPRRVLASSLAPLQYRSGAPLKWYCRLITSQAIDHILLTIHHFIVKSLWYAEKVDVGPIVFVHDERAVLYG
jgi:hypothetical protein